MNQQTSTGLYNCEYMKTADGKLRDFPINVKFKLSALWASVMFCYIYGDFFSLFLPDRLQNLMNGVSGVGATTPMKLLMFAVLMTLPSVMVFLSLALKAKANRRLNIGFGILFTAVMMLVGATSIGEWKIFYTYLATVEIILTSTVVWLAWRWQKEDGQGGIR